MPNATELVSEVIYNLLNKNGDELLKEGILPIGMLEPKHTMLENNALFIKVASYNFKEREVEVLKEDLPKTFSQPAWLVLFIETDGQIEHGEVITKRETAESIVFEVDTWITHTDIAVEGVRVASNFMTTKVSLLEAKRLQDLFVRSEVEYTVWKALRRVSHDILVELNSTTSLVDECKVTAFCFAEHRFSFQDNNLVVGEEQISEKEILENPFHIVRAVQKLLN